MWSRQPVVASDDIKPDWRRYVVDFAGLKVSMLQDTPDFMWQLKIQITTAAHFADQTVKVVHKQLWEILHRALVPGTARSREDIRMAAQKISSSLRSLHIFVLYHDAALKSLSAEHSKRCCHDASLELAFRELGHEVTALDSALSRCVVALGDIFSVVRANEEFKKVEDSPLQATWTAPQTFARSTTKYLVKMQNVMDVKLRILEHLPVLIIGRPEPGNEATISTGFLEKSDSAFITSVYLEDPAFQSYHTRLAREEGATLLRMRYYGYYGANKQPHAKEKVFMEQKIHHKKWTEQMSVKERFCLRGSELALLLSGHLQSGEGKEAEEALRTEVQQKVVDDKMAPLVRTVYRRTAFQRSSTNVVRISLDTEVKFLDETGVKEDGVTLGWAVLEIKLSGPKPQWVDQLLDCDVIQPLEGFSKFLHAVASLHHESGMLEHLPHWFEPPKGTMGGTGDDIDIMLKPFNVPGPRSNGSSEDPTTASGESSSRPPTEPAGPPKPPVQLAPRGRAVEPKTYFANERTFIQWLTAAALLLTFSSSALAAQGKALSLGLPIFIVACGLVCYALMIYHRRLRQFQMGGQVNYSDRWGPSVLAILLCITMAGVVFVTFSDAAPESNVGILPPVAYVEKRFARGCLPTPLVMNSINPDSWELQQNFPISDFSSMERRRAQVLLMDSRIRRFYDSSNISTDWSITVEKWCLPLLYPDCSSHFLKYIHESHTAILKFNNVGPMTVRPQPDKDRNSHSKFELDGHCLHSKLSYNLAIGDVPTTSAWTSGTDVINPLLATPFYKRNEPLHLKHTEFRTHYSWQLPAVGGSPAVVILELVYASAQDRLYGRTPTDVTLSTRLVANTTLLAINHAEGLIEYLRYGSPSRFSGPGQMCTAFFLGAVALVLFGVAYNNYALSHCWARPATSTCIPTTDDLHLYHCIDQPTVFRSEPLV